MRKILMIILSMREAEEFMEFEAPMISAWEIPSVHPGANDNKRLSREQVRVKCCPQ